MTCSGNDHTAVMDAYISGQTVLSYVAYLGSTQSLLGLTPESGLPVTASC